MLRLLSFCFIFLLSACTVLPQIKQLPPQVESVKSFKVENNGQQSLLLIQFYENKWRWIQTDPLGAPIARVWLTKQGWEPDGFVMPNKQAQLLFTALANGLNPDSPPFYLDKGWKIEREKSQFTIWLPDSSKWKVEILGE